MIIEEIRILLRPVHSCVVVVTKFTLVLLPSEVVSIIPVVFMDPMVVSKIILMHWDSVVVVLFEFRFFLICLAVVAGVLDIVARYATSCIIKMCTSICSCLGLPHTTTVHIAPTSSDRILVVCTPQNTTQDHAFSAGTTTWSVYLSCWRHPSNDTVN